MAEIKNRIIGSGEIAVNKKQNWIKETQ